MMGMVGEQEKERAPAAELIAVMLHIGMPGQLRSDVEISDYIAFSDEAYYIAHRYRSIAILSLASSSLDYLRSDLKAALNSSGIGEFQWKNLSSARERFAAIKLIDTVFGYALPGQLRIDVLVWDTHDTRHDIRGRDDIQNLERMYFHLYKDVLTYRWPQGGFWHLYPDQNSALDWASLHEFLELAGSKYEPQELFPDFTLQAAISNREFNVKRIVEIRSSESPEVQVCDLFAGLGAYSYSDYPTYQSWCLHRSGQMTLPISQQDPNPQEFSKSEKERCKVLLHLDDKCKENRLSVSLESSNGFQTHDPRTPINFWPYTPQHEQDKAPRRK